MILQREHDDDVHNTPAMRQIKLKIKPLRALSFNLGGMKVSVDATSY